MPAASIFGPKGKKFCFSLADQKRSINLQPILKQGKKYVSINTSESLKNLLITAAFLLLSVVSVFASADSEHSSDFNAGETVIHHIQDAYDIHFFSIGDFHASIPLPVILYSPTKGLDVFMSSAFHHGTQSHNGYKLEHGKIESTDHSAFYDLSMTKTVVMMMVSAFLLVLVFTSAAKGYEKNKGKAPSGVQSFVEPLILFIRDEIGRPILGDKADQFVPYLLSLFFFIWISNLLGLIPGFGANITGNIAVTMSLAIFTFVITMKNTTKHFWAHIFAPPGVPGWLLPIMWIVEVLGLVTKPGALMIRLFANMTAGHMIVLSIVSLIFIFGQMSQVAGYSISILSVAFTLFMYLLELLVAALQAYIFTILSALYFAEASAEGEHH